MVKYLTHKGFLTFFSKLPFSFGHFLGIRYQHQFSLVYLVYYIFYAEIKGFLKARIILTQKKERKKKKEIKHCVIVMASETNFILF